VKDRAGRLRALRALTGAGQGDGARPEVRADINVTPLVDVVLVLLIIFMVVTPLIASGVAVDLPRTAHHARKPDDGKDIIVSITADKRFYVGTARLTQVEALVHKVVAEKRRAPEKNVFVKADAKAPYGAVRAVLQALHEGDLQDVILGTEELDKR
jgi:biopolymer transport protein TolR